MVDSLQNSYDPLAGSEQEPTPDENFTVHLNESHSDEFLADEGFINREAGESIKDTLTEDQKISIQGQYNLTETDKGVPTGIDFSWHEIQATLKPGKRSLQGALRGIFWPPREVGIAPRDTRHKDAVVQRENKKWHLLYALIQELSQDVGIGMNTYMLKTLSTKSDADPAQIKDKFNKLSDRLVIIDVTLSHLSKIVDLVKQEKFAQSHMEYAADALTKLQQEKDKGIAFLADKKTLQILKDKIPSGSLPEVFELALQKEIPPADAPSNEEATAS